MSSHLTIGQLAKSAVVHIQTVRYYERLHLLGPAARASSGYRLYGPEEERLISGLSRIAQALGFTLRGDRRVAEPAREFAGAMWRRAAEGKRKIAVRRG